MKLVGVTEIAELVGVSRQRADQLTRNLDFPAPVADLSMGRIWKREQVEQWQQNRKSVNRREHR